MRSRFLALAFAVMAATTVAMAGPAEAQPAQDKAAPPPTADQIARAKTLFDLGAKAYNAESFPAAIQAFQEAYRLSQRPGPIFSTAQAYRRLYNTDRKLDTLRQAVAYYKLYVEKQKAGGRIGEAQQALRDLEPVLETILSTEGADAGSTTSTESKPKTRLMVSSPTPGALVSLDGGELAEMPLIQELSTGEHTLKLVAEGFFEYERKITAVEGEVYGLDIPLREKPAILAVKTDAGATISVDGRSEGLAPLVKPLELSSGSHLVTITKNGYRPYSVEVAFARGERRPLNAPLVRTVQRDAAYGVLGVAAAGLVGGSILAGLSSLQVARARSIEALLEDGNISEAQRQEHEDASKARDELRAASFAVFGGALISALVGAGLYVFDRPNPTVPTKLLDDDQHPGGPAAPNGPPAAKRRPKMAVMAVPLIGPGTGGGLLELRF